MQNYGAITSQSGDVVLLGNFLQNAGSVNAPRGSSLSEPAGTSSWTRQANRGFPCRPVAAGARSASTTRSGQCRGRGAEGSRNVYALAIKNDGVVRASGYNFRGGRLTLSAGPQGRIVNTGNLTARNADGSGGQVQISGGRVQIAAGVVDAAGDPGKVGDR